MIVEDWLQRLERSAEYRSKRRGIAQVVCEILRGIKDPSFLEQFMEQIRSNNEECSDRSSMALNEIYACLKIRQALQKEMERLDDKKQEIGSDKYCRLSQELLQHFQNSYEEEARAYCIECLNP